MALDLYLHAVWGELTYQQVDGNWTQIQTQFNALQSSFAQSIPKNNLTATTAPTAADGSGSGYSELSRWYDTVTETLYICIDPTEGAAVWIEDDFDPLGFGSAALAQLGTGPDDVPQNSDLGTAAYLGFGTGPNDLLKTSDADARYLAITVTLEDLGAGDAVGFNKATLTDFKEGTADTILTSDTVRAAHEAFELTDAATVAVDSDDGPNYVVTLASAASRVLGNISNEVPRMFYTVLVKGTDSSASTLTFDTGYGGELPTLDDLTDAKWYMLYITCVAAGHFIVSAQDASPP